MEKMPTMPTVWKLAELMARHRVTGKELALALKCSENTVSTWKKAETLPMIGGDRLDEIASAISSLSKIGGQVKGVDLLEDR